MFFVNLFSSVKTVDEQILDAVLKKYYFIKKGKANDIILRWETLNTKYFIIHKDNKYDAEILILGLLRVEENYNYIIICVDSIDYEQLVNICCEIFIKADLINFEGLNSCEQPLFFFIKFH